MTGAKLSAVVTTFNNALTLEHCLASLVFADELLVLDSGSSDATVAIAQRFGARVLVEPFKGYLAQKQSAIDHAHHDWILLLDADEVMTPEAATQVRSVLVAPGATGYELPRSERMFWRWQHRFSKHNEHLRLFDRRVHRMGGDPVHAAPDRRRGVVHRIDAQFLHDGETSISSKVERMNRYSSGLVEHRAQRMAPLQLKLRLILYPPWVMFKTYLLKRHFMNGWPGWIHAVSQGYYAFLKDAKALEAFECQRFDGSLTHRLAQQAQRQVADAGRGGDQQRPQ